jgi:16S rRNA (guanine966-N2)-methyltransferase
MRIIGGKYRHREIRFPSSLLTRPTKDMVRQGIFNALQDNISGKNTLDLFAGSGAMGIEALSRGANQVTFVDQSSEAILCIKKNLEMLFACGEALNKDVALAIDDFSQSGRVFDIIFLDPPYADDTSTHLISSILESGILSKNGIIVYESHEPLKVDEKYYAKVRHYRYGITAVTIMWR